MLPFTSTSAAELGIPMRGEMIEVNLLLPAQRLGPLLHLSRQRGQSIAQLLRLWIDRGLEVDAEAGDLAGSGPGTGRSCIEV